jgi:hypothetical protein
MRLNKSEIEEEIKNLPIISYSEYIRETLKDIEPLPKKYRKEWGLNKSQSDVDWKFFLFLITTCFISSILCTI